MNLTEGSVASKRSEIKDYFETTCSQYESLYETLVSDRAYYERACSLRHPLIFYFGHTATFFVNKLVLAKLLPERIDPKIEALCAIGVDEMSWDDLNEAHYDWPTVDEIRQYRQQVREAVLKVIDDVDFRLPIDWESPMWPVIMGIEHERIHLETSSVLIRQLPLEFVQPHPQFPVCPEHGEAPKNKLFEVPAGEVLIDHHDPADGYGWDNEYGHHQADIGAFKASAFLVSNGEYLEFVQAGGYDNPAFWSEEGNRWRQFTAAKHPTFWVEQADGGWLLRCMTEEIPIPWNWPVEVNALEAEAFCQWKALETGQSIRLPSEDEYLRLRDFTQALDKGHQANQNLQLYASSMPVNRFQTDNFFDVIGNVWQWTNTPIYPFTGFKVHPLYDDFTTPTFDNQHNLIKGSSWISSGNETNGHSRYAFRRHFFQHAGFRYIESEQKAPTYTSTYETDDAVAQYCEFHYGQSYFGVDNFAQACAHKVIDILRSDADFGDRQNMTCLEVGCSVGRTSFELAKVFAQVTGVDFSARFIKVANQLKATGEIRYTCALEGDLVDYKSQNLAALGLGEVVNRCEFLQQDAANLKPHLTGYDVVVALNLIDRLYDPQRFLSMIHQRMTLGGLLFIASPYTWLEEYTEKANWLGGYKDPETGENVTTLDGLHQALDAEFEFLGEPIEMPFVIRETRHKFQHSLSELTVWKRRKP